MGKIRTFHYFRPREGGGRDFHPDELLRCDDFEIEVIDRFTGSLELFVIPVRCLGRMHEVLGELDLHASQEFFEHQCREVISVPEKHIDEQTN